MSEAKESGQKVIEPFLMDMADHQRKQGKEATVRDNEKLAVSLFEQLEHKRKERAAKQKPCRLDNPVKPREVVKQGKTGEWTITRKSDEDSAIVSIVERWGITAAIAKERLSARVALLADKHDRGPLGQPSWHERLLAVLALKMSGRPKKECGLALVELCEASNEAFGDWKKYPSKPLYFDQG